MKGLIVEKNAGLFSVESEEKIFNLRPSGKTKEKGLYVGDYVEFDQNITFCHPRKNLLIRPPLANLDRLFIVIAPSPRPDFALIDKLTIYCLCNDIEPIIVVNKIDKADEEFLNLVKLNYSSFKVILVSAKCGQVQPLAKEISGISAFAGQSAVGKTSLINSLLQIEEKVGSLSKKVARGKQTTRVVKLFKYNGGYIADTAGFSLLDLNLISTLSKRELSAYYPEFLEGRAKCKYRSCLHQGGECGVIEAVKNGTIQNMRYQNYLKILQELKKE